MCLEKNLRKIIYNNFKYCTFRKKHILHDIMSTKEKQATPKAAFVFLVPLENEQPAQQAVKRVSAGS